MNFKKLEAYITVIDKKSFSEAAAALKSSQPAISIKIKSLEEDFGLELLDRGQSGIQPTAAGVLVYQASKDILRRWRMLAGELHSFQDTLTGTLKIGASTIPGTYLVPNWIMSFRKLFPKVEVKIDIGDSKKIINMLLDHQIDVGIVGYHPQSKKIICKQIAHDSLVVIAHNQDPISQSTRLDFNQIKLHDFVLREEGSGTRKVIEEYLANHGYSLSDLKTTLSISSTEGVIAAVEAGLGISIVSKLAALPAATAKRIKIIETNEQYDRNFYLTTLSEITNGPLIKEFTKLFLKG
jgi:DNA-binding transcriptional LysR family regulator